MNDSSSSRLIRVRDWDQLYENNRSREMKRTNWFPAPNDLSSDSYVELVSHENGAAHLGVWMAILMVASKATPRRGLLVKENGQPHGFASLSRVTRIPESVIQNALDRLLKIALLEYVDDDSPDNDGVRSHPAAGNPQDTAEKSHESAVEGKGREHHHQEGKRTERKGTERARDELAPEDSTAGSETGSSQRKTDDEKQPTPEIYASPEDELKAIYLAKAGGPITIVVLDAIRLNVECAGLTMTEFVSEVRKHRPNEWKNPAGFLRDLSKRFRSQTRVAPRPVTAAESEARMYQCPICSSRKPGEGAILEDGKMVPC